MNTVISTLKELGLNEYESRSYLSLLRLPRSSAPYLARETRIPTSKIYDTLNRLVCKGFVVEEPGKPRKFKALEPSIAMINSVKSMRKDIDDLESRLLGQMESIPMDDRSQGLFVVRGRDNVLSLVEKRVLRSKEKVHIRYSSDATYLKNLISTLKGVKVDFGKNDISHNSINIDGKEMIIYMNKKEAFWIRDGKYCKIKSGYLNQGLSKYTNGNDITDSQGKS